MKRWMLVVMLLFLVKCGALNREKKASYYVDHQIEKQGLWDEDRKVVVRNGMGSVVSQEEGLMWLKGAFWIKPDGNVYGDSAWLLYRKSARSDTSYQDSISSDRNQYHSKSSFNKTAQILSSEKSERKQNFHVVFSLLGAALLVYVGFKIAKKLA